MKIYGIKAREIMACAGSWARVAEVALDDDDYKDVYVMAQEYNGLELTVSRKSLYSFMVEDDGSPDVDVMEQYTTWSAAKDSKYAEIFKVLKTTLKMLGNK